MFRESTSIFIPSLKKLVRFRNFTNRHHIAVLRNLDSMVDMCMSLIDIVEDNVVDDIDTDRLTVFDYMAIYISWRLRCIDYELTFESDSRDLPMPVDLESWLGCIYETVDMELEDTVTYTNNGGHHMTITLGIPTMKDMVEVYKHSLTADNDVEEYKLINTELYSVCIMKRLCGMSMSTYHKFALFDTLPPDIVDDTKKFHKHITKLFEERELAFYINRKKYHFSVDICPIFLKLLVGGSITHSLDMITFLAKNAHITYMDYLELTPLDSLYIVDNLQESENENEDEPYGS